MLDYCRAAAGLLQRGGGPGADDVKGSSVLPRARRPGARSGHRARPHRAARRHRVGNQPGSWQGATFTVKLPLLMAPCAQPPGEPEGRSVARAGQPYERLKRLSGAHILAVDNEEDALGLLRVILESEGAQVATANSAQQALELLKSAAFDAVIADLGMPGMDGLELIRHIRRALPAPANRLPAVALTAYARSDDRITALASGFQMHLAKPVNPHALVIAVAALVGR